MVERNSCGKVMMDWKIPVVLLLGWALTVVWVAAGITHEVAANTEFRKANSPRIERMDTTLQGMAEDMRTMNQKLDRLLMEKR